MEAGRMTAYRRAVAATKWEPFTPSACSARLERLKEVVDERYRADLNVRLPIAFNIEGAARSETFVERLTVAGRAVLTALGRLPSERLAPGKEAHALVAAETWREAAGAWPWLDPSVDTELQLSRAREATDRLMTALGEAAESLRDRWGSAVEKHGRYSDEANAVAGAQQSVYRSIDRADDLLERLGASAALAAESGALLLTGEAGQGKTHLTVDTAQRLVDAGHPLAMVLGNEIGPGNAWTAIAGALGIEDRGGEAMVAALRHAARRTNRRALLIIDAVNETEPLDVWQQHLEPVRALVAEDALVALVVTCRSSYVEMIWQSDSPSGWTCVEHRGLQGREEEAAARYFQAYGIEEPRVPLLRPEFSTPLFLKIFCEGLSAAGLRAPEPGAESHNAMFDRLVTAHAKQIDNRLSLDPSRRVVHAAVDRFAELLAERRTLSVGAGEARELFESLLPDATDYPKTLYRQLLDVGLLRKDAQYDESGSTEVVSFTYNRFADHVVAKAVLDRHLDPADPRRAFATGQPLGEWLERTTTGPMDAATTQLPERLPGVELVDVIPGSEQRRIFWYRSALIRTLRARDASCITDRTRELLREAERDGHGKEVVEALWELAVDPDHPLGGDLFHRNMQRLSMPDRDETWGPMLSEATEEYGGLERLTRWAARGPYRGYDERVIEAAATALMWILTTPNRVARDYTTKALVQLLKDDLCLVKRLVDRFAEVDDMYLKERLAAIAYACVLRAGYRSPDSAVQLFRRVRDRLLVVEQHPNVLVRDSVRGLAEWCEREGLLGADEFAAASPPYRSRRPAHPRTLEYLQERYPEVPYDRRSAHAPGYEALWGAVSGSFSEWRKHMLEPAVRHLTRIPRDRPVPRLKDFPERTRVNRKAEAQFLASLSAEQARALLGEDDADSPERSSAFRFLLGLSDDQHRLYTQAFQTQTPAMQWHGAVDIPIQWAERWIFQRAVALGWTPERFAHLDCLRGRWRDRRALREGYANKYGNLALYELAARLTDTNHFSDRFGEITTYEGPWQLGLRDMDPTLPPARSHVSDEEERVQDPTFPLEPRNPWWVAHQVDWKPRDSVDSNFAVGTGGLPPLGGVLQVKDPDGAKWIALSGAFHWDEPDPELQDVDGLAGRYLGFDLETLIVPTDQLPALLDAFRTRSIDPNPDLSAPWEAYLGEIPWAAAAAWEREGWDTYVGAGPDLPLPVLVFTQRYSRGERSGDASLENAVSVMAPVLEVAKAGSLRWKGDLPEWAADGDVVLQSRRTEGGYLSTHSALLARRSWLDGLLQSQGWAAVVSVVGERHLYEPRTEGLIHPWLLFSGKAVRVNGRWKPTRWRLEHHDPAERAAS
jgi:hypothetical protein